MKWWEIALLIIGAIVTLLAINFFIFYPVSKAIEDIKQRPKF